MTDDRELLGLHSLIVAMGAAGRRLSQIDACEGGAGNLSVFVRELAVDLARFSLVESMLMPEPAPELAHGSFLVSGSGCRLRDIADAPEANLACVVVDEGGRTAKCYSSPLRQFQRPTSEFNSHIAVHRDVVTRTLTGFHALVHAQPRRVTFLSHHPKYDSEAKFVQQLYRWQPETLLNLPEGIGFLPFEVPGSRALMEATLASLRLHRVAVWRKHGLMARSEQSMMHAVDLVEYVETAANYEYMDLCTGEKCPGLSPDELQAMRRLWNLEASALG